MLSLSNRIMKIQLAILGFLFYGQVYSQSKVAFGLMVSPSIEQTISSHGIYNPRLSMNYGLKSKLCLTPKLNLNTGFILLDKGSVVPTAIETDLFHHAMYLGIPLSVQYNFTITKKLSFGPSIGLIYGRRVFEYFKQRTRGRIYYTVETWHVNNNYFGGSLMLETYYRLTDRVSLSIAPHYNRQLNDLWKYSLKTQERFDSFLVEMIFWYQLKAQ